MSGDRVLSNQRRILENEARLQALIDNTADAFLLLRQGGEILDVNDRTCQQFGSFREVLIGATPMLFDIGVTPAQLQDLSALMDLGERVTFDSRHRGKGGHEFPVESSSTDRECE